MIKTKNGNIDTPNFFPTVGWPAGRGEYDRLFRSLKYFSEKINHKHFLFNFASFAFGFTIPKYDFNSHFDKFKEKDLRDSLKEYTEIDPEFSKSLIVLLDTGGNRIFNKIVLDNKNPFDMKSYNKYIDAYFEFVIKSKADIFVSFDIGPSYTTRDAISKKGCNLWESAPKENKEKLNEELLNESIKRKVGNVLMMVVVSGNNEENFLKKLNDLYDKHGKDIDYLAIGGVANQGIEHTDKILKILRDFLDEKKWDVNIHGLGMGGLKNIPLLIRHDIDTCDVATPWRRACTDAISNMYVPLFDKNLKNLGYENALEYFEIYDDVWEGIKCSCPFCEDYPIEKIRTTYKKSDKRHNGQNQHSDKYYEMRVRIFYHNLFQHIALLKKLNQLKVNNGEDFLNNFIDSLTQEKLIKKFKRLNLN